MGKSIRQEFYLCKKRFGFFALLTVGSWFLGILGMVIFQQIEKWKEALFPIGTVTLLSVGSVFLLFNLTFELPQRFRLAVSMGKTRKTYLPALVCGMFSCALLVYFLGALGFLAERGIYQWLYPGRGVTEDLAPFLTLPWIVSYSIFETGISCFFGGFLKKSEWAGRIGFALVWILLCWCSGGFWEYEEADGSALGKFQFLGYRLRLWFTGFSAEARMLLLMLTGLAGMVLMYGMLRREAAN